jgi:AraC-like DNA-binding protein
LLLQRSDLTVAQIARLCGYPDPLYFSRRFRAMYGCSPRNFSMSGATAAVPDIGALRTFADRIEAR